MIKKILGFLILLFGFIQMIPIERSNPPEDAPIVAPPEAYVILQRSCFDCHSNQTNWPWYSRVAPLSFWMIDHVEEGREHLNFSGWGDFSLEDQKHFLKECLEEIEEGEMPLKEYLWLHRAARLSASDVDTLRSWINERTLG